MIEGLGSRGELTGLARLMARPDDWKTIGPEEEQAYLADGWVVRKRNKRSIAMKRRKTHPVALRSRVWTLLFRMGFPYISGAEGIRLEGRNEGHHFDVMAVDTEVCIAARCVDRTAAKDESALREAIDGLADTRRLLGQSFRSRKGEPASGRTSSAVLFIDREVDEKAEDYASERNVRIFDARELLYYEELIKHLGVAGRFQLLSEVFKGKQVRGLEIRVPALKSRVGRTVSYTFAVRPDYLLKVAYIAHRAKGKVFDLDAYQRMISRARLKAIGEFISGGGVFPTNIVLNFENRRHLRFEQTTKISGSDGALVGWLTIAPAYGAAWVIDGQHRLYAYSGHERAQTSLINVLAFEGLDAAQQTEFFVDINSEQRRVKRSLLVELDATLKWNDDDDEKRLNAIISKAGMALGDRETGPLAGRILLADVRRTNKRCVSLTAFAGALRKPGFFIVNKKPGQATLYGPLWREDPNECLRRTSAVVGDWLGQVEKRNLEWWDLGSGEGGGLAMNDGVTVCINVLRYVLGHLNERDDLIFLEDAELIELLRPYAAAVGDHFAAMSLDERATFRRLRGVQGQTTGTMMVLESLAEAFDKFNPDGLEDWQERRKANTNEDARKIIAVMERAIQARVIEMLKDEFSSDEKGWFFSGVPKGVRIKVDGRINEAGGGDREKSFDLLDYQKIIHANWVMFRPIFAYGERANVGKDKGTKWLGEIGAMRNRVMHPSRNDFLSLEELDKLRGYKEWLTSALLQNL